MVLARRRDVVVGRSHARFDAVEERDGRVDLFLGRDEFNEGSSAIGDGYCEQLFGLFEVLRLVLAGDVFPTNSALAQEEMRMGSILRNLLQIFTACFHLAKRAIHLDILKGQAIFRLICRYAAQ